MQLESCGYGVANHQAEKSSSQQRHVKIATPPLQFADALVFFDRHGTIGSMPLRRLFGLSAALVAYSGLAAVGPEVQEIRKKFEALRPPAELLRVYDLDWSPNLQEAKKRALKERRPILFVVVLNSYGNLFTGHC